MRVSASRLNDGENVILDFKSFARTTSTETCADAVNALLALDLIGDDLATLEDALLDVWCVVEHDAGAVPRYRGDSGDGKRLAIDNNRFALPVVFVSIVIHG